LDEVPRAKVFISCGQQRESSEREIANRIATRLREEGYDPYVAFEQQSLRAVKENIFPELQSAEYLIFIDFPRNRLEDSEPPIYRGSLFSHQELAIAAFLDLDVIALQEDGVKRDDGLLGFLQTNCISFSDRDTLPSVVLDTVLTRGWKPGWKRQLVLLREDGEYIDATDPSGQMRRFFHVGVHNLDVRRHATNCYVYLQRLTQLDNLKQRPLETIEFKWEGYTQPNATILPGSRRNFDAVVAAHDDPSKPQFSLFTDSTRFVPPMGGPGHYQLTFAVVSDNFPVARAMFNLTVGHTLHDWELESWPG
jgi:hypothetical protein